MIEKELRYLNLLDKQEKIIKRQKRRINIKKTLAVVSGLAIAITLAHSHNRELKINKEA